MIVAKMTVKWELSELFQRIQTQLNWFITLRKEETLVTCFLHNWQSIWSIKKNIRRLQSERYKKKDEVLLLTSTMILVLSESNTSMSLKRMIYQSLLSILSIIFSISYTKISISIWFLVLIAIVLRAELDVIRRKRISTIHYVHREVLISELDMILNAECQIIRIVSTFHQSSTWLSHQVRWMYHWQESKELESWRKRVKYERMRENWWPERIWKE
jgi:hypothetical protein